MSADVHSFDLSKFNVVQYSAIPDPIAGTWYWINSSFQSVRVNDKSVSLIPGEAVDLAPFQTAKKDDPIAFSWFQGAVARGYFGTPKTPEPTPTATTETPRKSSAKSPA